MGAIKVILNPAAGRGYGNRVEPRLRQCLEAEGINFDLVRTEGPWHATELAERAAKDGFQMIVAAGGDGTANEVINGLMAASQNGTSPRMGVIPAGSGSDFASGIGLPADVEEACHRIARSRSKAIDIGRVTVAGQHSRYFGNVVGVGFDGAVLIETLKIKRLRGLALYLLAVLKTIFLNFEAPMTTVTYDGQEMALPAMLVSVTNGPREGGGFFIAPEAKPDDGLFDVCIAHEVDRLTILRLLPHFLKGTHVDLDPITMVQARQVTISSPEGLVAHVDGEVLCTDAPWIRCEILPGVLDVCI
ncbi:MAG: diacylglycerol/lipid kinase family protein [bacterium]